MNFFLTQNDNLPSLVSELSDNQGVVDITNSTPVLYYRLRTHASGLQSGIGYVVGNGSSGVCQYDWTDADVAYPGVYCGRWKVNFSGGYSESFPSDGYFSFILTPNL